MRKNRKHYQSKFNKHIRALNRNIANDDLWKGRFEVRQKDANFEWFEDNSGGILYVYLRAYDKATGYYKDFRTEYAPYLSCGGWKIWEFMNNFIVNDVKIWDEHPTRENTKDYTNIHIPDEVMTKPYNFYLSYKYWVDNYEKL